jgi:hypothetical protein
VPAFVCKRVRNFFTNPDVLYRDKIMCASFIYPNTTVGFTGMINRNRSRGIGHEFIKEEIRRQPLQSLGLRNNWKEYGGR